jgi:hypothetical protein
MRFPRTFRRQKGGASSDPALGSDSAPTTAEPSLQTDCVLACKIRDVNGWPVQRIAACWTTTAATPTALNASLYFFERATGHWYLINSSPLSMSANQLYFFDTVSISEPTPLNSTLSQPGSPAQAGSMELFLLVSDPGSQVNGVFTFALGPDLTTVGT